jgi:hypothetical protein
MPITRTPMIDDDGTGTTGTIINNAWKQELYNQIDALAAAPGVWVDVPFSAANFTASGGAAWTVAASNVLLNRYTVIGKTVVWSVYVENTSISGATPAELYIRIPGGFTVKPYSGSTATAQLNDATPHGGTVYGHLNGTKVTIQQNPYAFFTANAATVVMFTASLEVL